MVDRNEETDFASSLETLMFLRWRKPVISQKVNDEISELSEETIHTI
jgi:hypothetical protein